MSKSNIAVEFSITGNIIPKEISSILGMKPTKVVNSGEFRSSKLVSWVLGIAYTDTIELALQLKKLIIDTELVNKISELLHIQETYDVIMRLNVCININTSKPKEKPVIWIDPIVSSFVGALGVYIDIDTYYDL